MRAIYSPVSIARAFFWLLTFLLYRRLIFSRFSKEIHIPQICVLQRGKGIAAFSMPVHFSLMQQNGNKYHHRRQRIATYKSRLAYAARLNLFVHAHSQWVCFLSNPRRGRGRAATRAPCKKHLCFAFCA